MTIGIPKCLYFYKYQTLILTFLNYLEIDYVLSEDSTKKTLEDGKLIAPDESCISLKLFLGHIKNLENRCNYILVPRIKSIKKDEKLCPNFLGIYDLVNNLINTNIIYFDIDMDKNKTERLAFIDLGLFLGCSYNDTVNAYQKAKQKEKVVKEKLLQKQTSILNDNNKKILLGAHSYNLYDNYLSKQVIDTIKNNSIEIIYSDVYDNKNVDEDIKEITKESYFTYSNEIIGAINTYKKHVNGIILLSSFPCALDSLTNELIIKQIKDIPIITITIDEQSGDEGMLTRLESFIDIINKEQIYD